MVAWVGEGLPRLAPDSGPELAEKLVQLRHVIDLAELSFAQLAADFAETEEYDEQGSVSAVDWIRINCHMTSSAAADRVRVGDHLDQLSDSVYAMARGEIGFAHLSVMASPTRCPRASRSQTCWTRLKRCRRAGSITSAGTTAMPPTPRALRASNQSSTRSDTSR